MKRQGTRIRSLANNHYVVLGETPPPFHGECAFAMFYAVDDAIVAIVDAIPIERRFRDALALSLVDKTLAAIVTKLLRCHYKTWLTPLVQRIETECVDASLDLLSRVVAPMHRFGSTRVYIEFIEASLSAQRLSTLHTRLCHLVTECNEMCVDNNNVMYRYHIPFTIIDACAPRLRRKETPAPHRLFMDLIHLLTFVKTDVASDVVYIKRLEHHHVGVMLNQVYLYERKHIVSTVPADENSPFIHPLEYAQEETLIDVRRLVPLYDRATNRISPLATASTDDILLLRVSYPERISQYGPSMYVDGTQLLAMWIANLTTLADFRLAMRDDK